MVILDVGLTMSKASVPNNPTSLEYALKAVNQLIQQKVCFIELVIQIIIPPYATVALWCQG